MADGEAQIDALRKKTTGFGEMFVVLRVPQQRLRPPCALGVQDGIYGNSREEAFYIPYRADSSGAPLNGATNRYVLRFQKGQLPPADAFWSSDDVRPAGVAAGPSMRSTGTSINSPMLPGLRTDADGGLTLYIQHDSPGRRQAVELAASAERTLPSGGPDVLAAARGTRRRVEMRSDDAGALTDVRPSTSGESCEGDTTARSEAPGSPASNRAMVLPGAHRCLTERLSRARPLENRSKTHDGWPGRPRPPGWRTRRVHVSPAALPRWWRRRSSSSSSSPRRHALPHRHQPQAPRSACAG